MNYKVIITGPVGSGKTTAVNSLSDRNAMLTDAVVSDADQMTKKRKKTTTVAMDYDVIRLDDHMVHVYGTPGQERFDFMWDILSQGMLGFVVMVDSTKPETFREAKRILETFESYASTPYVVAANKQDVEDAWEPEDLRIILRLKPNVKILPCVATDKETVKNVLLELLYSILDQIDQEETGN